MFNALNRFISRLDSDAPNQTSLHGAFGFQVLKNKLPELAIEPWFDFIVDINGRLIEDPNPALFSQEIRNCAGNTLTLGLWNAKGQRTRTIHVPVPQSDPTLGLTLQFTSLSIAFIIWHILDVPTNSPAEVAGLLPYSDYIIGTPEGLLHGESGLGELVEDHIGRPLKLFVYNNEYDVTREVIIHPKRDWGGDGALGCTLGFGALHRLPAPLSEPVAGPGETLFSAEHASNQGSILEEMNTTPHDPAGVPFMAASLVAPNEIMPPSASPGPRKEKRKPKGGTMNMEDYFNEGEAKSQELDRAPVKNVPPPPTKAGSVPLKAALAAPMEGNNATDSLAATEK